MKTGGKATKGAGVRKGRGAKKKPVSRSIRAGLQQFPVGSISPAYLKKDRYSQRVGTGVRVYLGVVQEYLADEVYFLQREKLNGSSRAGKDMQIGTKRQKGNIRVFYRVRPSLTEEGSVVSYPISSEFDGQDLTQNGKRYSFKFNKVFSEKASQQDVYVEIADLIQNALNGYKVYFLRREKLNGSSRVGKIGQAKTLMFVQLNPDVESYYGIISTLKFAEKISGVELGAAKSNKEGMVSEN